MAASAAQTGTVPAHAAAMVDVVVSKTRS